LKNPFFLRLELEAAPLRAFSVSTAHARQIPSIVTAFPKGLAAVCKKAFDAKHPGS